MKILIATGNPHKFAEMIALLPSKTKAGEQLEYVNLQDLQIHLPEETGTTLEENAQLKATYAAQQTGLLAISDDTGLEVDALSGRPGVYTARYAGPQADADDNNRKLLEELDGLLLDRRTARFRTVACLAQPSGTNICFDGTLEGFIGFGYRGENGFGYDPIFIAKSTRQTLAEMTPEQKNKFSHRAQAFEKVAKYLQALTN